MTAITALSGKTFETVTVLDEAGDSFDPLVDVQVNLVLVVDELLDLQLEVGQPLADLVEDVLAAVVAVSRLAASAASVFVNRHIGIGIGLVGIGVGIDGFVIGLVRVGSSIVALEVAVEEVVRVGSVALWRPGHDGQGTAQHGGHDGLDEHC
jgi:hypothetical protein